MTKDLSKLNIKQSCGLWEGKPFFFYFYPSRYFGAGPDSDLMMAPDDGSSIMTHPDGKGKKSVCLAVLLQLQPDCIYLSCLSWHTYTVSRPFLFPFFFGDISQTTGIF